MKALTKKQIKILEGLLQKIVVGVLRGAELDKKECQVLVQYMNNRDELLEMFEKARIEISEGKD